MESQKYSSDQISSFTNIDSLSLSSCSTEIAKKYKRDSYSDFESIENDSFFEDTQKKQDEMEIDSEFFSSYNLTVKLQTANSKDPNIQDKCINSKDPNIQDTYINSKCQNIQDKCINSKDLKTSNIQDKCINSGFKTANSKEIFVNQSTIIKLNKDVPIFSQLPPDLFNNESKVGEISEDEQLLYSLSSSEKQDLLNETLNSEENKESSKFLYDSIKFNSQKNSAIINEEINNSIFLNEDFEISINEDFSDLKFISENSELSNEEAEVIKKQSLEKINEDFMSDECKKNDIKQTNEEIKVENFSCLNENTKINSGFMTGNKKVVLVKKETIAKIQNEDSNLSINILHKKQDSVINSSSTTINELKSSNEEKFEEKFISQKTFKILQKFPSHMPMRSYNRPEKGHISTEVRYLNKMAQIYQTVLTHFKDENRKLIFNYFKWAWMSLFVRKESFLATKIIATIKKMKDKEYSYIKRVLEGDDIPMKYTKFLVIKTNTDFIELFDGFYSVKCSFDREIEQLIVKKNVNVGDRVKIFNFKLLFTPPINILDQKTTLFHLNYNSFTRTTKQCKLGYQTKSCFLNSLSHISKLGGPISCLLLQIKRIIQINLEIKYENYSKVIKENELEKETYKIVDMLNEVNKPFNNEMFRCTRYVDCIAKDKTGECLLVWYTKEEVKKDEFFYFYNLNVDLKKEGLCLVSKKGFYMKK